MAPRNTRREVNAPKRGAARSLVQAVDTYVRPVDTRDTFASDALASALGIAAEARVSELEKRNQEDIRKGQLEGLAIDASTSPAAIRAGEKYAQSSASFMAGLRESQSKAWAFQTLNSWKAEYTEWEGRNSNDPADFQNWIAGKMQQSAEAIGQDEYAIAGALPVLQQGINNLTVEHIAYTDKRVKQDEMDAMRGTVVGYMEMASWDADPTGQALMAALKEEADIRYNKGLDGKAVNEQVVKDVIDFADSRNDTRYLAALAQAHDDGTYKLNAEQQERVEAAVQSIESELASLDAANAAAAKAQDDAWQDQTFGAYAASLQEDPMSMPDKAVAQTHPKLYKQMLSLRGTFNKERGYIDPAAQNGVLRDVMDILYGDMRSLPREQKYDAVLDLLAEREGQFSEGTITRIFGLLKEQKGAAAPFNDPLIKQQRDNIAGMLKSYEKISFGESGSLQTQFEYFFDQYVLEYGDLSSKSPSEKQAIIKEVMPRVYEQMMVSGTVEDVSNLKLLSNRNSGFSALSDAFGIETKQDIDDATVKRQAEDLRRELRGLNDIQD